MRYETQWEFLKNSALLDKLSHAYVFSGNDEAGQEKLALALSQLLNCEVVKEKRPCGVCVSCKGLQAKTHPDALWITETREIPIGAIRNLRTHFSLSSWQSPYKIAIIQKAHLMNVEAQSALLKLLEELRHNAILFLLCEYPDLLLNTIRSRAQEIRWYAFPTATKDSKDAQELNHLKGSLIQERFDYAKKTAETPEDVMQILEKWVRAQRSILLGKLSDSALVVAQEKHTLQTMQEMLQDVKTTNVTPRLALEQVLLEL